MVTAWRSTAGRLLTTVQSVPILSPAISISLCLFKKHWTEKHFQQMPTLCKETSYWLQTRVTTFFYAGTKTLVPQCDKCLNVIGKYAEAWCVPSAIWHVLFFLTIWLLGSRRYLKFPKWAYVCACVNVCIHTHIHIYNFFIFTTATSFPKTSLRQILNSLIFQSLKLRPIHCLSHL